MEEYKKGEKVFVRNSGHYRNATVVRDNGNTVEVDFGMRQRSKMKKDRILRDLPASETERREKFRVELDKADLLADKLLGR